MEESFINAMERGLLIPWKEVFNDNVDEIRFKIEEHYSAAQVAKAILELSKTE